MLNDHLGSSTEPCYIQNHVIGNRVIKRLRCVCKQDDRQKCFFQKMM